MQSCTHSKDKKLPLSGGRGESDESELEFSEWDESDERENELESRNEDTETEENERYSGRCLMNTAGVIYSSIGVSSPLVAKENIRLPVMNARSEQSG